MDGWMELGIVRFEEENISTRPTRQEERGGEHDHGRWTEKGMKSEGASRRAGEAEFDQ